MGPKARRTNDKSALLEHCVDALHLRGFQVYRNSEFKRALKIGLLLLRQEPAALRRNLRPLRIAAAEGSMTLPRLALFVLIGAVMWVGIIGLFWLLVGAVVQLLTWVLG